MKCKKNDEFADLVDKVSALSKKDYQQLWLITRQYRKANKMFEKTLVRQRKEAMPKKSKAIETNGLDYEFAGA